jgi:tripartite-type tricarboxylate transporter receptor subunit TctC
MPRHIPARSVFISLAAILAVLTSGPAASQPYPAKPVRFIVPFSAGSGSDTIGRIVGAGLGEVWGRQVIVDNRAGAAGNIGAELAAKSAPDGYTLFLVNMGHAANVTLYPNMPYDLLRDFAPVTQIATSPAVVVVHPSLPVKSMGELVKLAKAKPGVINYASGGSGTPTFIAVEMFKSRAGIDLLHVPYRAGGEALTSVLSGETSVYFSPLAVALPHIRGGKLRALAVTSTKRLSLLPESPTVAESGYPGYEAGNWYGLMVPVKTPKETSTVIRNAAISSLQSPAMSKRLTDLGYVAVGDQPEEFAAYIKAQIAALAKVIRETGVTAN